MEDNVLNISDGNFIVEQLVREIRSGMGVIGSLVGADYRSGEETGGSIGSHFRHNLDIIGSFLNGLAGKRIDYSDRERDQMVEKSRAYAIKKFVFAERRLRSISDQIFESLIFVRSEIDAGRWYPSSVARELEFVLSHTVHHHAMIAEKMNCLGRTAPENFGVSPSTLRYWTQQLAA